MSFKNHEEISIIYHLSNLLNYLKNYIYLKIFIKKIYLKINNK